MGRPELIATEHRARWLYAGESAEGFVVRNLTATIDDLPAGLSGFRFLHISDLHLTRIWRPIYAEVAQKVQQLELDLVLCTGDIVDDKRDHRPALPNVLRFLPALKSRLGTFAILGNHDSPSLGDDLMAAGITLLHGQHILDTGLGQIEIIGTPGRFRRDLSHGFARGIPSRRPGIPRIVMAHYPDHWPKLKTLDSDLYLCGHTHGGQVCLPGGWPIIRHDQSPRRFCRGNHQRGRTLYIVSHGLGFTGLPVRLFCPPEIGVVTLARR